MNTVMNSKELSRIKALPYREIYSEDDKQALIEEVTLHFAKSRDVLKTRPLQFHQALALAELAEYGMLFGGLLGVGSGKTDISYLASTFFQRPLLLLPGKLANKADSDVAYLSQFWKFKPPIIMSYEQLSRDCGDDVLYQYRPDGVIADEAHYMGNMKSGRTKKFSRFMDAHPDTTFIPLTGTPTQDAIGDFHHLMVWSMGNKSTVPVHPSEALKWSEAIGVNLWQMRDPGALLSLVPPERKSFSDTDEVKRARKMFAYRMRNTPCVQSNNSVGYSGSLNVFVERVREPSIEDALKGLEMWTLPDGKELVDPLEINRYGRQLSQGFYYLWDPAPPESWLKIRKDWGRVVRRVLNNVERIDTPYQVQLLAQEQGLSEWSAWEAVRKSYVPETKAVFVSEFIVPLVKKFLAKNKNTVVWVEHRAAGELLSKKLNMKFFSAGGLSADGQLIDDFRGGSAIAMQASCGTGHNLQMNFHNNLILSPTSSAKEMEQILGRTHRMGQPAREVNVNILSLSLFHEKALAKVKQREEYMTDSSMKQKLSIATIVGW